MPWPPIDITTLSIAERIAQADLLWSSVVETPQALPVTAAQLVELNRRLDEADQNGAVGVTWGDVLTRLRDRAPGGGFSGSGLPGRE